MTEILKPTRRGLLRGAAALGATGAITSPLVLREAHAQAAFNWKRFSGTTIDVLLVKNPRSDLMQAAEKEFTELTGIKVSAEQVPEQQQRQKAVIEFASGKPSFDVSGISLHVQKRMAAKGKWFADLTPFIKDASLTSPDFNFEDFGAGAVAYARQSDGALDTLPFFVDYWMVYYNKELFDAKGVAYPKSMDEMAVAAAKLHDPAKGVAGFVSRGLKNANVPVWACPGARPGHRDHLGRGQAAHRHARSDLGRRALQEAQQGYRPGRRGRLQLERVPDHLHAGPRRDVARRHRLCDPARGPQQVAYRRQGRLWRHPAGAEGAPCRHVRRRHRHLARLLEEGGGPGSTSSS